jgi:uncharacterized protein YkwD
MTTALLLAVVIAATPLEQAGEAAGANVQRSEWSDTLARAALGHAAYMAAVQEQGHQGFVLRAAWLRSRGFRHVAEICAESWPWQRNDSERELWTDAFWAWRQSPGHWSVAGRRHRAYGGALAQSREGVWYSCIIVEGDSP